MKKILYVVNKIDGRGGLNRIAFDKINYLVNYYQIDVLYYGSRNARPFYEVDERVRFHNIEINAFSSFYKKITNTVYVYFKYKKILKEINPDIIINLNSNILSWIIPFVKKDIPKIIELHQSYDGVIIYNDNAFGKGSLKSKFLMGLRKYIYPLYQKVIVLTNTDKKKWGFKNTEVIPNFTNIKSDSIKKDNKQYFLWVGRLSHQKGIDLLIKIWDKFTLNNSNWNLILIGKSSNTVSDLNKEFLKFINGIHKDRIDYIEETTDIINYYNKSSIYLSTSRYEGLPLCLIEASTMGKPIIGFNITGNDEVIVNNVNGILVDPGNIDNYVKAMIDLSNNETKLIQFSNESLKRSQLFNKDYIMKKWIELINNLTNN